MQSSKELKTQIDQINREIVDIKRSLPRLTSTTDLLDAQQELKNRADVLVLLQERLTKAQAREAEYEKRRKREALEAERVAARENFDRLTEQFDGVMEPLIAHIVRELDTLSELGTGRQDAHNRHLRAANELGWGSIWGTRELTADLGWTAKGEADPTGIRKALFGQFAARRGIDVSSEGVARAAYMQMLLNEPRPQQPGPVPLPDVLDVARQGGIELPFDQ